MTAPNQPQFLVPSSAGQLSNKRGANTGADALAMQAKYRNPLATGDLAGTIRVLATRILSAGQVVNDVAWDGSAGVPTTNPISSGSAAGACLAVTYNSRIYVVQRAAVSMSPQAATGYRCQSAAITGGAIGAWRNEGIATLSGSGRPDICGATVVIAGGVARIYFLLATGSLMFGHVINPDGALGKVVLAPLSSVPNKLWYTPVAVGPTISGELVAGVSGSSPFLISIGGAPGAASNAVSTCPVNSDGTLGAWTAQTVLPATRGRHAVWLDPLNAYLVVAGGDDNTTAATTVWTSPVTGAGTLGAWTASTNALPLARSAAGVVVSSGFVFVVGGSSTNADTGSVATVYSTAITTAGAVTGAWASPTVLPINLSRQATFLTGVAGSLQTPYIAVTAGRTAVPANNTTTYENQEQGNGTLSGSWTSGVNLLTAANLGTGGTRTDNQDGSQTFGFAYGAFGATPQISGLTDGDQIQVVVTFTDSQGGDISLAATTIIKVGQPPTITNLTVGAGGEPTATWNFTAGAGGAPQASWQATIATLFDSGLRYDQNNNVVLAQAPKLANAVQRTVSVTVTSADTTMPGSLNSATTTANFTPAYTASALPTSVTATPNHAQGKVTVTWTNPGGSTATTNRVYYRRNGGPTFLLLKDAIAAVIGSPQSMDFLDELALNVTYDFAVSAVGPGPGESTLVVASSTAKIDPVLGGYSGLLHIAGGGTPATLTLLMEDKPQIKLRLDSQGFDVYAQSAPSARYGVANAHQISIRAFLSGITALKTLQALMAQAQLGNGIYYRDAFGTMLLIAFLPDQTIEYAPPLVRYVTLTLFEIANQFAPSLSQGSATGYRSFSNGGVVALDTSEGGL